MLRLLLRPRIRWIDGGHRALRAVKIHIHEKRLVRVPASVRAQPVAAGAEHLRPRGAPRLRAVQLRVERGCEGRREQAHRVAHRAEAKPVGIPRGRIVPHRGGVLHPRPVAIVAGADGLLDGFGVLIATVHCTDTPGREAAPPSGSAGGGASKCGRECRSRASSRHRAPPRRVACAPRPAALRPALHPPAG